MSKPWENGVYAHHYADTRTITFDSIEGQRPEYIVPIGEIAFIRGDHVYLKHAEDGIKLLADDFLVVIKALEEYGT